MKIAIVQDELLRKGGAEQVTLSFHKAFPEAPIFTIAYNPETTYPEFKECVIRTSVLNRLARNDGVLKLLFYPFGVWAMRALDLSDYDVVLQSTTHCAKYVRVSKKALVITYCHTPFRLVFRPDSYAQIAGASSLKKALYGFVINQLRKIDTAAALRTDYFLTNASVVVPRIEQAYQPRHAVKVIPPAVKTQNFHVSAEPGQYYLVVSRFEPYKKVDLVIEAFNGMPQRRLVIVGTGSREGILKAKAAANIEFKKDLSKAELQEVMSGCKALVFPQLEDYGITPLEINASGRPVIAFGEGGVRDTMIPYTADAGKATAVFFEQQTPAALSEAIEVFEKLEFDPQFIRSHAEEFSEPVFVSRIREYVNYCLSANTQPE